MTRFFVQPNQIEGATALLDGDDAHHLRSVIHALPGDKVAVLDGTGRQYSGVLESVGKTRAVVQLGEYILPATEARTRITVAQALPKVAEKMEQVLQRGTEIGAAAFWGFTSERSQTHLTGERQDKRLVRWRNIVKTAAEQSHRAILPEIRADQDLLGILAIVNSFDGAMIAYEGEEQLPLKTCLEALAPSPKSLLIIIGPEGGFTKREVTAAKQAGVKSISLGPRILRTETAAMVLISQILYCMVELVIVLGVGDRALQGLLHLLRNAPLAEGQGRDRGADRLVADQTGNQVQLARADTDITQNTLRLCLG